MSNVASDSRSTSDGHILVRQIENDSIADDQQLEVLQCLTVLSDGSTEGSTMTIKIEEQVDDESADDGNIIISNTFTAVTLADGTQAFVAQDVSVDVEQNEEVQLADLSEDGAVIVQHLPKFLEGHAIQLEDGTTAILPTGVKEGRFQQVELEDGSTAFVCLPEAFVTCIPEKQDDEQHSEPVEQEEQQDQLSPSQSEARNKCFMCTHEGCGKYYTTLHHLKVHERAHTGDRPFRCTVSGCNKAFATGYGRKAHIRTHTGEKPYRCPEESCGKGFKTSGDLQKHLRTHTGERPFHCPVIGCNRSFTTSNIRKVHIRTHTGERPYVCTEEGCVRAFASATNYKNHLRIHSGEKPYVCSVKECGKRFTEYSSLYKHHMVHTQMKPYLCTICSRHYRQASTLTMHKRTAHGIVEADDGTEIFFGDRVLELANTGSSSSNKKLKTLNSNFLGFRKDGNTLVAVQTSDDSAGLQSFQGTTGRLVFVADSDLERYGLEVKDCIEEQTCQIEFADDESSNSIIT